MCNMFTKTYARTFPWNYTQHTHTLPYGGAQRKGIRLPPKDDRGSTEMTSPCMIFFFYFLNVLNF